MINIGKKIKSYYQEILICSGFLLLTLVATYPVIFRMNTDVYGPLHGTDYEGTYWELWYIKHAWLNHLSPKFSLLLNYPFGIDLSQGTRSLGYGFLIKYLVILTNEVFFCNLTLLVSFFLSAVILYYLVYRFTKNKIAGFISGIIFAFCPYHFNKAWEHFLLAQIQWMPLYTLTLLNLWKKPIFKNALFCALVFTLVIIFDFTYAYIMSIFTLGFLIFLFVYRWIGKLQIKNNKLKISFWKILRMVGLAMFFTLFINLPMLYNIFKIIFFAPKTEVIAGQGYLRSFSYLFTQSARPLNYFLPAAAHPLFGGFTRAMFGSVFYGRGSIEQTLYLGWIPLALAFIAFKKWRRVRKKPQTLGSGFGIDEDFYVGLFIFSAIFAFLFSMPPYFNLGFFKIYFPSFFMYKILPMFRAYARFGIMVMLCVSVLAGFGLKYVLEKFKTPKKRFIFTTLITCLVLFEFANIPPFHVTDISKPPAVYQWLKEQPGDFAIVEYPLGETVGPGEAVMPYDYLFYQRIHQKKLINGAQIGTYAYKVKQKINKIMAPETPGILKWLGAKYVVIHLDRYKTAADSEAMDILGEIPDLSKQKGIKLVKKFDDTEVYEVTAVPIEPKVD